jgi:hypothetical protein
MTSAGFAEREFKPSLAQQLEHWLKENPNGPFSAELLEKFARLKREQPRAFARCCRHYPALAAAVKLDVATVRSVLENASKEEVVEIFIDLVLAADLSAVEIDALRRLTAEKSGVKLRPLTSDLKQAQAEQAAQRAREARAKRRAARTDPRPMVREPADSDPWLPVISKINAVLSTSAAPEPPARDIEGYLTRARKMALPGLHLFSTANEPDDAAGSLPPPEQWLLQRMGEIEVAELIERHIDYVNAKDESVHLKTTFVKHYIRRDDDVLPLVVAIATLPIVLGDGTLLAPAGFDRKRGIIFKVPKELRNVLPRREGCDDEAVRDAMRFLCDDWLCDVAADYTGKCIQIAYALTLIERALLPERPTFSVTAGKSGGGKTTLFKMLIMAVTGQQAAAAAWSTDENERRKALLSYLLAGVPYILWDNIPRGTQISCPHIERSCTAAYYSDRLLGVTETVIAAASAIHSFTGNNTVPVGDLATRDLHTRLTVDRPDPENREFKHPDPIGWTKRNRAEILAALYTILLGNPMLKQPRDAPGRTRFKDWYRLVGSAVEHAARLAGHEVFSASFLSRTGRATRTAPRFSARSKSWIADGQPSARPATSPT